MVETALVEKAHLVIGTRGCPQALTPVHALSGRLAAALGMPMSAFPHDIIRTAGNALQDRALPEAGGHAVEAGDHLHLHGMLLSPDGSASASGRRDSLVSDAVILGTDLGRELRARAPFGIHA